MKTVVWRTDLLKIHELRIGVSLSPPPPAHQVGGLFCRLDKWAK